MHIWGTSPDSIDIAEDRDRWMELLTRLNIRQPAGGSARSEKEAYDKAHKLGYPVMIRPSYVLGGRAMEILYNDDDLKRCVPPLLALLRNLAHARAAVFRFSVHADGAGLGAAPPHCVWLRRELALVHRRYVTFAVEVDTDKPVLVDKYLDRAVELDVDALCDKDGNAVIAGIMEHIEQAGIHSGAPSPTTPRERRLRKQRPPPAVVNRAAGSIAVRTLRVCPRAGDSACSIPTQTLSESVLKTVREWTLAIAKELKVVGLINIQFAVQDDIPYIIEANPRASRCAPTPPLNPRWQHVSQAARKHALACACADCGQSVSAWIALAPRDVP